MGGMWLWWILIIVIGVVIWRAISYSRRGDGQAETPEQTLKRRFAKGEIDEEQYHRMLSELRR